MADSTVTSDDDHKPDVIPGDNGGFVFACNCGWKSATHDNKVKGRRRMGKTLFRGVRMKQTVSVLWCFFLQSER